MNGQAGVRTFVERYPLRPNAHQRLHLLLGRLKGRSSLNGGAAAPSEIEGSGRTGSRELDGFTM